MVRGAYKYLPKDVMEEFARCKNGSAMSKDADIWRVLAKNSKIGREIRDKIEFNAKKVGRR